MALFVAENLRKRFGARVVLENISLSIEEGSVHGIMGPNGAGKTTCFHVLTGHHRPDGGRITFDGRDITGKKPHQIARLGVSRSFQIMNLFDDTVVIENVILALKQFRRNGMNLLRDVFSDTKLIDQAIDVLDQVGLAHRAWEKAAELPYGERRALEIAVALAPEPRIVFLDEPTSGLGTEATRALAVLIRKLRARYTIVLIEHDMRFLFDLADRISVIHWGQVIDENTPDELQSNKWVARSALGEVA
ncbi:ABC transporter ATP-binding protein [Hoeflea alexandrii]|uniref:ATP-binding cassette domain-containing protein n=1 Tax=Hoeflea alexandrii TaxID=288436 RepID=A0ABT1CMG1_9HYPH|nr:ABC transporter ATP-binding protein [Hoeflea alexandrii]MCO6406551.1 ATP-binding cassette domain-containing protein [Hoeflea alexandrii]MCY0154952.1 ABC transporter ATP-binding protein [Hoeflea alexandrii]